MNENVNGEQTMPCGAINRNTSIENSRIDNGIIGAEQVNQADVIIQGLVVNVTVPPLEQNENISSFHNCEELAIKEIVKLHFHHLKDADLQLQGVDVSDDSAIPIVHPTITEISYYGGDAAPTKEDYNPVDRISKHQNKRAGKEIKLEDLLNEENLSRFVSLVGYPGSGKTVCSKRLARSCTWPNRVCFYLRLMDMNYKDKLTLQELLINKLYPGLANATCDNAFSWLKKHNHKIVLILDGFDQAEFTICSNPSKEAYDTPQLVQDLIANLCNKHFLPNCKLVVTSRPHSLIFLPKQLRPSTTYLVGDMTFDSMKRLFYAYAGTKADEVWSHLNNNEQHLVPLCHNPLMLQLIISACLHPASTSRIGNTLTLVFHTVMENLKHSDNHRCMEGFQKLALQIGKLAFLATSHNTVVITPEQLREVGLDPGTVQDIVIQLVTYRGFINNRVFDGDTRLYFCHQTFQEWFAALHIVHYMAIGEFEEFVKKELFKDHWMVVRRFVCGLLINLGPNEASESFPAKRSFLSDVLTEKLTNISPHQLSSGGAENLVHRHQLFDLYGCVSEGNSVSMASTAAKCFPTRLQMSSLVLGANQVTSLCFVLKRVTHKLEWLGLSLCELKINSFRRIASVIKDMRPGQIGRMIIDYNDLDTINFDDVIGLLRVVTDRLSMIYCFTDGRGGRKRPNEEEKEKIQDALNNLENPNLKVWVGDDRAFCKNN
ncbi:unnamed protein product [Clavelina lepadiformis]|uniref:NACHT domain-containing protein n=1 Tax=Clavelina lepadiformis TaxID=159417 RepID=A0ABP0FMK7_CLALP